MAAPRRARVTGRGRRARRRLALPAVAVAAGVVALAAPSHSPQPLKPAPATAATVLAELGRKAARAPAQTGRYAYEKRLSYVSHMRPRPSGKGSFVVVLAHEDELWVRDDGTGVARTVIHEERPAFPTPEDKADYEAAPKPPPLDSSPHAIEHFDVAGLDAAEIRALPTDPARLRARIESDDVALTAVVGQLLATPLTPPAVKAALFELLKGLPGATLENGVRDPLDRTGTAVRFQDEAWSTLFLFDPRSGRLLGTRAIGHKELPGRDIDDWSLVVDAHRTGDAPAPTARTLTSPVA